MQYTTMNTAQNDTIMTYNLKDANGNAYAMHLHYEHISSQTVRVDHNGLHISLYYNLLEEHSFTLIVSSDNCIQSITARAYVPKDWPNWDRIPVTFLQDVVEAAIHNSADYYIPQAPALAVRAASRKLAELLAQRGEGKPVTHSMKLGLNADICELLH